MLGDFPKTTGSRESDKKQDPLPLKFTKYEFCFDITQAKIDAHFSLLKTKMEDACKFHKELLTNLCTLNVFWSRLCLPESILRSDSESSLDLSRLSEPSAILDFSNESEMRSKTNMSHAKKVLVAHYESLEKTIVQSESENGIGIFIQADVQCLKWFNSQYSESVEHWPDLENLRQSFAKDEREYLIDYFLAQVKEYRSSVYDPLIEQMCFSIREYFFHYRILFEKKILEQIPDWQPPSTI